MKKFFLLFLLSLVSLGQVFSLNLRVVGFSNDSKYLSFELYGHGDYSGFPYSAYHFINVDNNSWARRPISFHLAEENATLEDARREAYEESAGYLTEFGIIKGNTGNHVFGVNRGHGNVEFYAGLDSEEKFLVSVSGVDVGDPECVGLKVTLTNLMNSESSILQIDKTIPKSRGCPIEYGVRDIFVSHADRANPKIAVFVGYKVPGMGSPDRRIMVVTGELR